MKKILKLLFLFLILFSFNSVVNASNVCFYMPGKNNTVIVPKGYYAQCYYKYEPTKSNNNASPSYEQIALTFTRNLTDGKYIDKITVSTAYAFGDTQDEILYLDEYLDGYPSEKFIEEYKHSNNPVDWDGLELTDSSRFDSYYDPNIDGCPKSFYWIDDNSERYHLGFSSSLNPDFSFKSGAKYSVYSYTNAVNDNDGTFTTSTAFNPDEDIILTYDDIMLLSDTGLGPGHGKDNIIYYKFYDKDKYDNLIKNCDSSSITGNKSEGSGNIHAGVSEDKIETLNSCSYYFEFKNHFNPSNSTCFAPKVTFTYQKKTESGKSSLAVTSDLQGLNLENITDKFREVNLDDPNTYSKLNDYLIYKDGKWYCADTIYTVDSSSVSPIIFGRSRYSEYFGTFGKDQVAESHTSNAELCPPITNPDSDKPGINPGDPVEVNCEGILGKELIDFLNKIFRWIQILAPIFVIIISGIDFAGAVLQDDKDALKKASNKFIKRLIIAVALFFVPLILSWLLNIFNDITGAASSTCGVGE